MNEKRVDLNLLRVFHAVMTERSVTLAARRLAMSQPAVSNALRRLRQLFGDPLFVKGSRGVDPTRKATEVWPELHDSLERIRQLVSPPEFDPGSSRLTFSIAITDSLASKLVAPVALRFASEAPGATLQFHSHDNTGSIAALQRGSLDCAIGMFPRPPADLHTDALFTDDYVCVVGGKNALWKRRLTLKAFVEAKHVLTKPSGTEPGVVDNWLSVYGLKRDIAIVVNHFPDALSIVQRTDLVTAMPRRLLSTSNASKRMVRVMTLPFDTEKILYKMLWHERTFRIRAQIWLRELIKDSVRKEFSLS
jgi:DNA-binding transcriptional LysR family regulator